MGLADEYKERTIRDGLRAQKFYICITCEHPTPSYEFIDKCPECGVEGEMTEASSLEQVEKIKEQWRQPGFNKLWGKFSTPAPTETDALGSLLNTARAHYYAKETPRGDMVAAEWLIRYRSVKTDRFGKLYVYHPQEGHYKTEGEIMLKADLLKEFGTVMNRTRVGEVIAKVQALSYSDQNILESTTPPNLLPLQNGVYDLLSGRLLAHSPEYFFTYKHPAAYNPNAECTLIHKFLEEIVPNVQEKEILLDVAALCLYRRRTTPHFFVFVGGGRNGKSLWLNIIKAFVGKDRIVSITPQALAEDVFAPAQLYDKHANLGADIPGGLIRDVAVVKSATGGDRISVQRKGIDRDEREIYCQFVWASNDPPRIVEDTTAIWTRLVVVEFPYTFVDSPMKPDERQKVQDLEEQLITQDEMSGLLNECIKRIPFLVKNRKLSVPIIPEITRKKYRTLSDTPAVFIDEACEEVDYEPSDAHNSASGYITADEAYRCYKAWCKNNRAVPVSSNRFGRAMENLGFERGKDNQQRSYRGLALKQRPVSNRAQTTLDPTSTLAVTEEAIGETIGLLDWRDWLNNQPGGIAAVDDLLREFPLLDYEKLRREGDVYEPRPGFVRMIL